MELLSHQAGRQFSNYLPLACGVTKQCTWNEKLQLASLHFAHYHQQWRLYCWNLTHTFANNAWGRTKFSLRFCTVGPLKVNGPAPQLDAVICDSSWDSCSVGLPLRPTERTFPTQAGALLFAVGAFISKAKSLFLFLACCLCARASCEA